MRDHHMTYNVVITPEASRQMEAAAGWWARERSEEQARQWYAGIRGAVATLAEGPERHPLAAEHADFGHELRELHYGLGRRATHRPMGLGGLRAAKDQFRRALGSPQRKQARSADGPHSPESCLHTYGNARPRIPLAYATGCPIPSLTLRAARSRPAGGAY